MLILWTFRFLSDCTDLGGCWLGGFAFGIIYFFVAFSAFGFRCSDLVLMALTLNLYDLRSIGRFKASFSVSVISNL
jgi:hypothetical protein